MANKYERVLEQWGLGSYYENFIDQWPGLCSNGKRQSPINIPENTVERRRLRLNFEGGYKTRKLNGRVFNTGYTGKVHFAKEDNNHTLLPYITSDGLDGRYFISELHFHWESEHTINGKRYPLELQIVHFAEKYKNYSIARNGENGMAILSLLHQISDKNEGKYEAFIAKIPAHTDNPPRTLRDVDLSDFLPTNVEEFYRYDGSITVPDCTESVVWSVFTEIQPVSQAEVDGFKKMYGEDGAQISKANDRKIQPLNGRKILLSE